MAWGDREEAELQEALADRARERAAEYRIRRLHRFVEAGFSLKQANDLELAGVACYVAEQLVADGCDTQTALRILL